MKMELANWKEFERMTTDLFSFLINDFEFTIAQSISPFIIYMSKAIEIDIYYDINGRKDIDLQLWIAKSSKHESLPLGINTLIQLENPDEENIFITKYPRYNNDVKQELKHLSN